jgi:dolichol-phosphate mannosyltransferase
MPFVIPERPTHQVVRLSLVVPTYQESENISELIDRLDSVLDTIAGLTYEIIVVDDDSPDHTWEIAIEKRREHPCVRVLRRQGERGLATAVFRGWQVARGEILGVMDADLQHPPEVMNALMTAIDRGADLAIGSRHVQGGGVSHWSAARRVISRAAQLIGLAILPEVVGQVSDPMSGYFLARRSLLAGIETKPLGYKILIEVLARARPQHISEVGYVFQERPEGKSKIDCSVYVEYLQHLFSLRASLLSNQKRRR